MTRYFLNLRSGDRLIVDPDGSECADLDAARAEARAAARDILAERLRAGHVLDHQRIEITDAAGTVLDTVALRDVLKLP